MSAVIDDHGHEHEDHHPSLHALLARDRRIDHVGRRDERGFDDVGARADQIAAARLGLFLRNGGRLGRFDGRRRRLRDRRAETLAEKTAPICR